ncbi:hypothetical protein [Pseudorhodobacter aquimaris]|uniref:hypothetical protein n=1 Tax=Pseudorhodobacter aquimaris TaxID=687412 RepID=UPI00067D1C01|nr:hypothetical protein [Pseudorhodobacter aquimaris]
MTPQLTKIRSLEPDAILVVGYVEPAAFIYRQSVELGIDVPRFGFTSGSVGNSSAWPIPTRWKASGTCARQS